MRLNYKHFIIPLVVIFLAACTKEPVQSKDISKTSIANVEDDLLFFHTSKNFSIGTRVTKIVTDKQIEFINQHYDYVMTPFLREDVRSAIQGPQLILYRSIQGTWTGFNHFDWEHIDATESMFEHHNGKRILTIWDSWLMDPNDMVAADSPDAVDHWINYYAETASEQIYKYGYDGLFIDSASHRLWKGAVIGGMPDDYNEVKWRQGRAASLAFIKSYLPDKQVVFNGLHSRAGAEESLGNTDGGMWEIFAFQAETGTYFGAETWLEVIELTARNSIDKTIILVVKNQPGLTEDIQKRTFAVASYLIVSNENVVFSMNDLSYADDGLLTYYPEYTLELGEALHPYTTTEDENLYIRQFDKGLVLVNPYEDQTITYSLEGEYLQVVPVGGGIVSGDGDWEGSLEYVPASGEIIIPPISSVILVEG